MPSSFATDKLKGQAKKGRTAISPEQTKVRIVAPPEVPYDTRICIENLVDTDSDELEIDELREEREVRGKSVETGHVELVQRKRWNAQTKPSATIWARKASKPEMCVASCSGFEYSIQTQTCLR